MLRQVRSEKAPEGCPGEDLWLKLAARVLGKAKTEELLRHACECSDCAQRLKKLIEHSNVEIRKVPDANSYTSEWQDRIARRMARQYQALAQRQQASAQIVKPPLAAWKSWAIAAAVILIGFVAFQTVTWHPNIESLLAKAYSDHRTLEARIPGAAHSELMVPKGAEQLLLTSTFIRAAEAINSLCGNREDDPKCLLYQARLDLLDWKYQPALAALAKIDFPALATPPERRDFLVNHALALFEKAQNEKMVQPPAEFYKAAAEDLSQVLQNDPLDTAALFNRALIYEELQMYGNALADWQHLIQTEKDPGWKNEAQRHLDAIQEKKSPANGTW